MLSKKIMTDLIVRTVVAESKSLKYDVNTNAGHKEIIGLAHQTIRNLTKNKSIFKKDYQTYFLGTFFKILVELGFTEEADKEEAEHIEHEKKESHYSIYDDSNNTD